MKKTNRILSIIMILTLLFALASCSEENPWETAKYTEDTSLGEGATTFTLIVEVLEHSVTFTVNTDEKTVGDALLKLGVIEGVDSQYGLYMKKVNGVLADYDKNQRYWAFYINNEYASSGVDLTEIKNGETYKLVYSK